MPSPPIDFERLRDVMRDRLEMLAPPEGYQDEYLAGRRWLSRALILVAIETVNRHTEEIARSYEYRASASESNAATFKSLRDALKIAIAQLAQSRIPDLEALDRITDDDLIKAAQTATTHSHAREQILASFWNQHDIEMGKHYSALAELMEVDPERAQRIVIAVTRTVVVQATSIVVGLMFTAATVGAGPAAAAGAAFGLLVDAPALRKAFAKQPGFSTIDDRVFQEFDEFEIATANWCIATELVVQKLRQVRGQKAQAPDIEESTAMVIERLSALYGT